MWVMLGAKDLQPILEVVRKVVEHLLIVPPGILSLSFRTAPGTVICRCLAMRPMTMVVAVAMVLPVAGAALSMVGKVCVMPILPHHVVMGVVLPIMVVVLGRMVRVMVMLAMMAMVVTMVMPVVVAVVMAVVMAMVVVRRLVVLRVAGSVLLQWPKAP